MSAQKPHRRVLRRDHQTIDRRHFGGKELDRRSSGNMLDLNQATLALDDAIAQLKRGVNMNKNCNEANCSCDNTSCERHGKCCECVNHHQGKQNLIRCMRDIAKKTFQPESK